MTPELNLTFLDHQKWDTSKKFFFFLVIGQIFWPKMILKAVEIIFL